MSLFGTATTAAAPAPFSFGAPKPATTAPLTFGQPVATSTPVPLTFGATTTTAATLTFGATAAAPAVSTAPFVGLGGTQTNADQASTAGGGTTTGANGKIEKPRDVQVPAEMVAQFQTLKMKLEEQKRCVDDLSAVSMETAFDVDDEIERIVKSLHVLRAQMRTTSDRIGQLRDIQRSDSRQTEVTQRSMTTMPLAANDYRSPINYLLSVTESYDTIIDTYSSQVLALERLIAQKLARTENKETPSDSQLESIIGQVQQFDRHFQELKQMLAKNHERVESLKFHVRQYYRQVHGDMYEVFTPKPTESTSKDMSLGPDVFATPSHTMLLTMAETLHKAQGGQTSVAQPAASGGLFGAAAKPTGGLFGPTAPTGGLFGSSTATTGGLFGKPATSAAPLGGGLFGGAKPLAITTPFGGTTATSTASKPLFGATQNTAAGTLFGANTAAVKPFSFGK